jgi:hypothetical protein
MQERRDVLRCRVSAALAAAALSAAGIGLGGCVGEVAPGGGGAGGGTCGDSYLAAVADTMRVQVAPATPGGSPPLVFEMYVPGPGAGAGQPILKTREIVVRAPGAVGFLGFDALGAGATIGAWEFDYLFPDGDFDGANYTIPLRALAAASAYGDNLLNGAYDAGVDGVASHELTGGEHVFTVTLPGGGANNGTPCSYFDTDVRFTLAAGILTLPATPGDYPIEVTATSVDPDTGDADDGQGAPPQVYQRTASLVVPEPGAALGGAAAFAALAVRAARRQRPQRRAR